MYYSNVPCPGINARERSFMLAIVKTLLCSHLSLDCPLAFGISDVNAFTARAKIALGRN